VRERSLAPVHALRSARRRSARLVARPARYKLSPSSSATTRRRCESLPPAAAAGCRNKLPRQRRTPTPPVRSVDLDDDARTMARGDRHHAPTLTHRVDKFIGWHLLDKKNEIVSLNRNIV